MWVRRRTTLRSCSTSGFTDLWPVYVLKEVRGSVLVLYDIAFEASGSREELFSFSTLHTKLVQSRHHMSCEHIPVAITDTDSFVKRFHLTPVIVGRSAKGLNEKIDDQLTFLPLR